MLNGSRRTIGILLAAAVLGTAAGCGGKSNSGGKEEAGSFAAEAGQASGTASSSAASESAKPTPPPVTTPAPSESAAASAAAGETAGSAKPSPKETADAPAASTGPATGGTADAPAGKSAVQAAPPASTEPSAKPESPKSESGSGSEILWSQFFDDEKQNTPSAKFWDMSGKTVSIKGYMGEVLSFEKHWFLIVPQPGAECPFDNGDETYWNKIMIAFTDGKDKLRHTAGPLKITGRLDVGIKIDESGYKTMFRLYDATVEKLKE